MPAPRVLEGTPADDPAGKVDAVDLPWIVGDGDPVAPLVAGGAGAAATAAEGDAALGERAVHLRTSTMRRRRACQVPRSGLRLLAISVLV